MLVKVRAVRATGVKVIAVANTVTPAKISKSTKIQTTKYQKYLEL